MPMTPQPIRSPALPGGCCVLKSSGLAWTMSERPMIELRPLSEITSSVRLYDALPVESALRFPRSPTWRLASSGPAWGMPVGLKWPPGAFAVGHGAVAEFMDVESVLAGLQAGELADNFDRRLLFA